MHRYICLLFIFLECACYTFSQTTRLEIEVNTTSDQFNVVPIDENGVVLLYQGAQKGINSKNNKWIISRYDTALAEIWSQEILLNDMQFSNFYRDNNFVYFLFIKQSEFSIVKLNIENADTEITKGRLKYTNFTIEDFKVIGENAFWGGSAFPNSNEILFRSVMTYLFFPLAFIPNFIPGKQAMLMHSNLENKITREIAFNYKGTSSVTSIEIDSLNQKFNTLIYNKTNRNSTIYIQDFNYNGLRNKNIAFNPYTPKYQILNSKLSITNNSEKIIIGTYSYKNNLGAQGVYMSNITNYKQNFIQYHSFTTMKNFFEYLDPEAKENIKNRIEKRRINGKELVLDYQFLIHDITQYSNNYILVAEGYQPQYHSEFRTVWVYGRPMEQIYDVFDGWKYTHAAVMCMDSNGKLIWDECFPIQNVLSFTLNEKTKIAAFNNNIVIANVNKNEINYQVISNDSVARKKSNIFSEKLNPRNDKKFLILSNDISFWYEKNLLSYGVKTLSNENENYVNKNNKIYYLVKLEYKQ